MGLDTEAPDDYARMLAAFGALTLTTAAMVGCSGKLLYNYYRPQQQRQRDPLSSQVNEQKSSNPIERSHKELSQALKLTLDFLYKNKFILYSTDLFEKELQDSERRGVEKVLKELNGQHSEQMRAVTGKVWFNAFEIVFQEKSRNLGLEWSSYRSLFLKENPSTQDFQEWGREQINQLIINNKGIQAQILHDCLHVWHKIDANQLNNRISAKTIARNYKLSFIQMFEDRPESVHLDQPEQVLKALIQDPAYAKSYEQTYGNDQKARLTQ